METQSSHFLLMDVSGVSEDFHCISLHFICSLLNITDPPTKALTSLRALSSHLGWSNIHICRDFCGLSTKYLTFWELGPLTSLPWCGSEKWDRTNSPPFSALVIMLFSYLTIRNSQHELSSPDHQEELIICTTSAFHPAEILVAEKHWHW